MRIAAILVGLGVFTAAGAARADGFFVTLKDGAGAVIGTRVQGAQFQTTTASAPTLGNQQGQAPRFSSAHLEIDDWGKVFAPSLSALSAGTKGSAVVEFTKPDARGVEQIYMTASFANVVLTQWQASFAPSRVTNTIDFAYEKVQYQYATATTTKTTELPIVKRSTVASPRLDDAILKGVFLGGAEPHLVSATVSFLRVFDANTGNQGPLKAKSIAVTRVASMTPLQIKSIGELDFDQKAIGSVLFALEFENASASSISGNDVTITFQKTKLVDKTAGTQVPITSFTFY